MKKSIIPVLFGFMAVCCGPVAVVPASDDDMIDMGYGKVSRRNNSSSASKLDLEEIDGFYSNIFDYMRGRVPGVLVGPADNGEVPEITIRGVNTINGDPTPLFIVDGAESGNISYIDPNDVRSISVLKGPEAAIYGARGAYGVIVITTKAKGK